MFSLRYTGALIAFSVAVLVWLTGQSGMLQLPSNLLYDFSVRHGLHKSQSEPKVLLLQPDPEQPSPSAEAWLSLVDLLHTLGAARVLFTTMPINSSEALFAKAATLRNVFFTQYVKEDLDNPGHRIRPPLPSSARGQESVILLSDIPQPEYGSYRSHRTTLLIDGERFSTAEALVAGVETAVLPEVYTVNYLMGPHAIPRVKLSRVLSGGLVPQLVRDRIVLIGTHDGASRFGLYTPLSSADERMPLLEFQGYAVNTLVTGEAISTPPTWLSLVMLVTLSITSLFAYQALSVRTGLWATIIVMTTMVLTGWLVLSLAHVWLPVMEALINQLMLFSVIARRKSVSDELALEAVLRETSSKLKDRVIPSSFYQSSEPWSQVIAMVNQTLDVNRLIFLERVPDDHRIREIKALNCSLDDINEMRRDYERTPYSTAIEANGPIKLTRTFLKAVDQEEEQYLVPLVFASEVLGFWAFGVAPRSVAALPGFHNIVRDFGNQIAELLYHRKHWQLSQRQGSYLEKYLMLSAGSEAREELDRSLELLERRLRTLEGMFDGLSSATVMYDLFGRLVQMNRTMQDVVQNSAIAVYEMTALDLVQHMTGLDTAPARQLLQHVVVTHQQVTLPARLNEAEDRQFLLRIRALKHTNHDGITANEATPFQMFGILLELIDVTDLKNLCKLRDTLVERINYQLLNDMESLLLASGILANTSSSDEKHSTVIELMRTKINEAVAVISEAQTHLDIGRDIDLMECYPIDPKPTLKQIASDMNPALAKNRLRLTLKLDAWSDLVMAEPGTLRDVFKSLLQLLIVDAVEDSEIVVTMESNVDEVIFDLRNSGFGMPDDRFQELLFGGSEICTEEYRNARTAIESIKRWQGNISANSELGTGIHIRINLRSFL